MAGSKRILRRTLGLLENLLHVPIFPRDRILAAVSEDGLHWRRVPGVAVDVKGEHGSEMVYWPHVVRFDGFSRMYFVGSQLASGQWRERILSAKQDSGGKWIAEPGERLGPSLNTESRQVFSPWIVKLDTGYRMYYASKSLDGRSRILSALSANGLSWRSEPGVRLEPPAELAENVSAPAVIAENGGRQMYCTCHSGHASGIGMARSTDGLQWEWTTHDRSELINPGPRLCAANPSPVSLDGKCRLYYSGHDGNVYGAKIYYSESLDFKSWSPGAECLDFTGPFEGAEVEYCHVIRNNGKDWVMYYTGFWGRHLLAPLTRYHYRRNAALARASLESLRD